MTTPTPQQPNTLGNASLGLGLASAGLVFGIGLCALVGVQQGWAGAGATPLLVCGVSSAFLGFLGAAVGVGGLFGANRSKATAIAGLSLSLMGMCLFRNYSAPLRRLKSRQQQRSLPTQAESAKADFAAVGAVFPRPRSRGATASLSSHPVSSIPHPAARLNSECRMQRYNVTSKRRNT